MCEPATIMAGAAMVMGAMSAQQSASAQQAALYRNAQYDETRARDVQTRGGEEIFQQRLKQAQIRGAQTASLAARGVDLNSGSAFNILQDTDYISDMDISTIADNTARDAWALRERAGANRAAAGAIDPGMAAATSLLGGAAKVYKFGSDAKIWGGGTSSKLSTDLWTE